MILVRASRAAPSSLEEMGRSLAAVWKLRGPQPTDRAPLRDVAAVPQPDPPPYNRPWLPKRVPFLMDRFLDP